MMNIYDVVDLEREIDRIANENDGVIPDALFEELLEKQVESKEKMEKLIKYIKHLEHFITALKDESLKLADKKSSAENRIQSIKKYLTPYVSLKGKQDVGVFTLSTRKVESVFISPETFDLSGDNQYVRVSYEPDKIKIKEILRDGKNILGASLQTRETLQIK